MRKKKKSGCALFVVFVSALICAAFFTVPMINEYMKTQSTDGEVRIVEIPEGASTGEIAQILKENGLVKSTLVFKIKAKQSENGGKMNYGTFELHEGMCIDDIIDNLAASYSYKDTVRLTIPEGYSVEQIATEAEKLGLCARDEFFAALEEDYEYDFIASIPDRDGVKYKLQGYLYPDTYEFYHDASAHDIIDKMLANFNEKIKNVSAITKENLNETIITASLLEREALLDSEMRTIAGVIKNRLDRGMKLQVDASVQYAVSDGYYNVNRITYDDLKINSQYNTYKVDSLPVGAICNPSIKAIEAALSPEKHSYLYYHTDTKKNDGSHIFTKTYEEHLATQ